MKEEENNKLGKKKEEYIQDVVEGVMIKVEEILILREEWFEMEKKRMIDEKWMGIGIKMDDDEIKGMWEKLLIRKGRKLRQKEMEEEGKKIMKDVLKYEGVMVGIVGVVVKGWQVIDKLIEIMVEINIIWKGWKVIN